MLFMDLLNLLKEYSLEKHNTKKTRVQLVRDHTSLTKNLKIGLLL